MRFQTLIFTTVFLFSQVIWSKPTQAADPASNYSIVVGEIGGADVWIRKGGASTREPLKKGQELKENDTVEVGSASSAILNLSDGSIVNIGPFSQYQILKPEMKENFWTWSFRLIVGTVRSIVNSGENKDFSKFRIRTEAGTAGVRGTDFVVAFSGGRHKMDLYTLNGEVFLSPGSGDLNDPKAIFVKKGQTSSVEMNGSPSPVKEFRTDEFLKKLKAQGFSDIQEVPKVVAVNSVNPNAAKASNALDAAKEAVGSKSSASAAPAIAQTKEEAERMLLEGAAAGDSMKVLRALDASPNIEVRDANGMTPLLLAIRKKSTVVMKALIDAHADANNADSEGNSPLITAVRFGDLEGVVLLRITPAILEHRNNEGKNATQYAKERGDQGIIGFLDMWGKEGQGSKKDKKKKR